jgi:hypothetical protein
MTIAKINGVLVANIAKIAGVAIANIAKINGVSISAAAVPVAPDNLRLSEVASATKRMDSPDTAGSYVLPYSAALEPANNTDFTLVIQGRFLYNTGVYQGLLSAWENTSNDRRYTLAIRLEGKIYFAYSSSGLGGADVWMDWVPLAANNDLIWYRGRRLGDDTYIDSSADGITWTQRANGPFGGTPEGTIHQAPSPLRALNYENLAIGAVCKVNYAGFWGDHVTDTAGTPPDALFNPSDAATLGSVSWVDSQSGETWGPVGNAVIEDIP